jgi:hypothetical protein
MLGNDEKEWPGAGGDGELEEIWDLFLGSLLFAVC